MKIRAALVFVSLALAAACGSNSSTPSSPSPTPGTGGSGNAPNTVTIPSGAQSKGNSAYAPNPITVAAGTTVTWTNTDSTAHTATSDNGAFDSGTIGAGGNFSFTFQTRGTFPYHCTFHRGMVGSVVVQ
jgi:plastocyanin